MRKENSRRHISRENSHSIGGPGAIRKAIYSRCPLGRYATSGLVLIIRRGLGRIHILCALVRSGSPSTFRGCGN